MNLSTSAPQQAAPDSPPAKNSIDEVLKSIEKINSYFTESSLKLSKFTESPDATPPLIAKALNVENLIRPKKAMGMNDSNAHKLTSQSIKHSIQFGESPDKVFSAFNEIQTRLTTLNTELQIKVATINATLAKALERDQAVIASYLDSISKLFRKTEQQLGPSQFFETFAGRTALLAKNFNTPLEKLQSNLAIGAPAATAAHIGSTEIMTVIALGASQMPGTDAGAAYKSVIENASDAGNSLGVNFDNPQGGIIGMTSLLEKLRQKYGDTLDDLEKNKLNIAFGNEKAANLFDTLFKNSTQFNNALTEINNSKGLQPAIDMANQMTEPWAKITYGINAVWSALGVHLEPQLKVVADAIGWLATAITLTIEKFPILGKSIVFTGIVISGLAVIIPIITAGYLALTGAKLFLTRAWTLMNKESDKTPARLLKSLRVIAIKIISLTALAVAVTAATTAQVLWNSALWVFDKVIKGNLLVLLVVLIVACVAAVVAAIYYWDEWTTALLESEAFKTVAAWFESLSGWFNSMGGWSDLASAAWDSIVEVFNQSLNALIELLNSIPGVNIETRFGALPEPPGQEQLAAVARASASISAATPSLITTADANKVPAGGLLNSIQSSTQQNRGTHVEKVEIHTSKPMTSHDLQGLLEMTG